MSGQEIIIHQFHPTVAFGDAITQQMFLIRESLHQAGIGGEIFARQWKGLSRATVRPFSRAEMWNADLLLVHHSSGYPDIDELLKVEVPKALVYHNITPAHFYRHDPFVEGLCRIGREQLRDWLPHVVTAFADSRFNAAELESLGYRTPQLLPLLDLKAPLPASKRVARVPGSLLFVGRLCPHKNQALLITTLFYLKLRAARTPYRLLLAGSSDLIYESYLRLLTKQLGLESDVDFLGKVSHGDLHSIYRSADAYVSASLHEGFGVPLVEAMRFEVPVFALPRAGVEETLGRGGIRLPSDRPSEVAAVLGAALGRPDWEDVRAGILADQRARLEELKREQSADLIPKRLKSWVEGIRRGPCPPSTTRQPSA